MIRIRDLSLPPDGDMARLVQAAARQLRTIPILSRSPQRSRRSGPLSSASVRQACSPHSF